MRLQSRKNALPKFLRGRCVTLMLVAIASLFAGCAVAPDSNALIHTNPLYLIHPRFVGPEGPVTVRQAQQIVARLKDHQQTPSDILQRHIEFEQALSDTPLTLDNQVTLLENAALTYQAMLTAIRAATNNINMQMYIFSDGRVGQMFADALIEAQHRGVQVNLMYDSLGSLHTPSSFFDRMGESGIALLKYRPIDPFEAKLPWSFTHRNHRKALIVDGRIAFTGGINISEDYASGLSGGNKNEPLSAWRDTDIKLEGPAVAEFQRLFINEWYHQKGPDLASRNYFPQLQPEGHEIVRVIASVPERFSKIYVTLVSAIVNAQTNVYITDAYFAPDDQMLDALENAARRGVDVRLLLPSKSDEPFIVSAEHSHYSALLKAGVKIFEWQGEMLHAKTVTVDGVWSTVGTSNLDWWSIARNNELNAIILSHSFAAQMDRMFGNDLENARPIALDQWRHRGLRERLEETAARIAEPLL